ncbi:hypothetical protein [Flagellimonas sp. S3867]|uniref:hypothetical protein n=1 Tax=Flagellimonas sp. S3867 TaxID=2768063 RepID=UPI001688FEA2|nr:hypothetical protein [Flagellimonas sp. S3867]
MKESKRNNALKRVIVDYKKLNKDILDLIMEKYADGYGDRDIISFRNAQGEWVECIEVKTEDTLYLVKVSKRLTMAMEEYDEESPEDEINITESKDFEEE